jgi:hypothetical protein
MIKPEAAPAQKPITREKNQTREKNRAAFIDVHLASPEWCSSICANKKRKIA